MDNFLKLIAEMNSSAAFEENNPYQKLLQRVKDIPLANNPLFEAWCLAQKEFPSELRLECKRYDCEFSDVPPTDLLALFFKPSRQAMTSHFGWAIPDEAALQYLVQLDKPFIDIGCGKGYWSALLQARGVNIQAVDYRIEPQCFVNVHECSYEDITAEELANAVALLIWPPQQCHNGADLAKDIASKAQELVYVGEWRGGSTATAAFFDILDKEYELVERKLLPNWPFIYDKLWHYKRRKVTQSAGMDDSIVESLCDVPALIDWLESANRNDTQTWQAVSYVLPKLASTFQTDKDCTRLVDMIAEQQNCAGSPSLMRHILNGVILKLSCLTWECNDLALYNYLREKVDFPTQQLKGQLRMAETAFQLCEKETGEFVLSTLDLPEQTKAVILDQLEKQPGERLFDVEPFVQDCVEELQ